MTSESTLSEPAKTSANDAKMDELRRCIIGAKKRINDDIKKASEEASDVTNCQILTAQKEAFYKILIRIGESPCFHNKKEQRIEAIRRELFRINELLPALATRLEFEAALSKHEFIVVVGDNGSGKSTQLPQYIVDMPDFYGKKVLCTQPRRIAAVTLAQRVAYEYAGGNENTGKLGYFVGFEIGGLVCKNDQLTCIEYLTEGILVRQLMEVLLGNQQMRRKVLLDECSVVIVDEVHERNLYTDLLLGLLKLTKNLFPKLKIVVASATMDAKKFSTYFNDCPILRIPGRCYPVAVHYEPVDFGLKYRELADKVADKALAILKATPDDYNGGILCFLTGQAEIETAIARLSNGLTAQQRGSVAVFGLFGKQTPEEQQQAFEKLEPNRRRVVFATDVAETSVTVQGITYVIDCGLSKDQVYLGFNGERSFPISPISKSSAQQRAGRAGRISPGICHRLYSEETFARMSEFPIPEVWRKPLGTAVTTLLAIGQDPFKFDWPDRPPDETLRWTLQHLTLLGVIDERTNRITAVGKSTTMLQMEPDICRLLHCACLKGMALVGVKIAALMRLNASVFLKNSPNSAQFYSFGGDFVTSYRALEAWLAVKKEDDLINNNGDTTELASENVVDGALSVFAAKNNEEEVEDWTDLVTAYESEGEDEDYPALPKNDAKMVLPDTTLLDALPVSKYLKEWSLKNGINCSIMVLISMELDNILRRLQAMPALWNLNDQRLFENRPISDEQIQRLILQAMFVKTALYEVVAATSSRSPQVAYEQRYSIPMTETKAVIGNKSIVTKLTGNSFNKPWCVVFHEAFRPAGLDRLLLDGVTPIDPRWLVEDCPDFYAKLMTQVQFQAMRDVASAFYYRR